MPKPPAWGRLAKTKDGQAPSPSHRPRSSSSLSWRVGQAPLEALGTQSGIRARQGHGAASEYSVLKEVTASLQPWNEQPREGEGLSQDTQHQPQAPVRRWGYRPALEPITPQSGEHST